MAITFNGSTDVITVNNSNTGAMDFTDNHAFAVSVWVNVNAFGTNNDLIGKGYDGSTTAWQLECQSTGAFNIQSYNGGLHGVTSATGFSAGVWTHVYGGYDGANWFIYVNGTLSGSAADAVGPVDNDRSVFIGALQGSGSGAQNFFNGSLAEIGVWNSVRSAGEIAALSKGFSPQLMANGLVFYAPLIRDLVPEVGAFTMSPTGTTVATHTRVIMPRVRRVGLTNLAPPPPPTTLFAQACL